MFSQCTSETTGGRQGFCARVQASVSVVWQLTCHYAAKRLTSDCFIAWNLYTVRPGTFDIRTELGNWLGCF
jgi:hypothetical protein